MPRSKKKITEIHFRTNLDKLGVPKDILKKVDDFIYKLNEANEFKNLKDTSEKRYKRTLRKFWALQLWLRKLKPDDITKYDI